MDRATELRRVAQVLHRKPEELGYLQALDGQALLELRTLVQKSLIDQFGGLFQKLASSGKLIPDGVSALLCRKVFGPALTANLSYYVPPDRVARMCRHFDGDFMAAVAREQVPERARELLDGLPVELMRDVMRKMIATKDYHILGAFLDHLPQDKAIALAHEIRSPEDYLRIAGFAQKKDRVAKIAASLDDDKLKKLTATAFEHAELMLDIGLITAEMTADEQRRVAKLTDELSPDYRRRLKPLAEQAGFEDRLKAYFA